MKIINKILLLSLILVISCDDKDSEDGESISIVGDWDVYWKMGSNWTNYDEKMEFESNGNVTYYQYGFYESRERYVYCEDEDILHIDSPSTNCECGGKGTSTLDYNGENEFTMTDCYGEMGLYLKLVRK